MYCKVQQCALKKRKLERRKLVYSFVAGLYANPPKQTNLTRNGTINKDVLKISIPPIDAQRCGVKEMTSGGVFSQDVESGDGKWGPRALFPIFQDYVRGHSVIER